MENLLPDPSQEGFTCPDAKICDHDQNWKQGIVRMIFDSAGQNIRWDTCEINNKGDQGGGRHINLLGQPKGQQEHGADGTAQPDQSRQEPGNTAP